MANGTGMDNQPRDPPPNQEPSTSSGTSLNAQRKKIPWEKFPTALIDACEQDEKPDPVDRREMIRILMDHAIRSTCSDENVGRNELRLLAQKVTAKYPRSFADKINGKIVGDGSQTLLQQLENRRENVFRNQKLAKKRKAPKDDAKASKEKVELDSYGCIKGRWEGEMQEGSDPLEVLEETRKKLLKEYEQTPENWDKKTINQWMESTFNLQRKDINELSVKEICQRWPFLFEETWMAQHFKLLTGMDIQANTFASKAERLYTFFKTKTSRQIVEALKIIKEEMQHTQNKMPIIDYVAAMLTVYFGEKISTLVCNFQDVSHDDKYLQGST